MRDCLTVAKLKCVAAACNTTQGTKRRHLYFGPSMNVLPFNSPGSPIWTKLLAPFLYLL